MGGTFLLNISKMFASKAGQLLGKASYAFYLVHVGFIEIGLHHFISRNILVLFVLLNLVSIGLYLLIEEPLNKKVKGWLVKRKATPIGVASK